VHEIQTLEGMILFDVTKQVHPITLAGISLDGSAQAF